MSTKKHLLLLGSLLGILGGTTICAAQEKSVDVIFTHDLHSHLDSYKIEENGVNKDVGGFARLQTVIHEKRAANPDTLVLDAGDFSMGTMYHTVFATDALEYRMLGELGFDAVTFGNHEFDFGTESLASMLDVAAEKGENIPPLVVCNADWANTSDATKRIESAAQKCGLADYVMIEKGDLSIAVTGVFGLTAYDYAPTCELIFKDPIESVKATVENIKKNENPDAIICISHGGTDETPSKSEDELLAKAVPDLDLIVSGHTHTALEEPVIQGNTIIASSGEYGRFAGSLSMEQESDGNWKLADYKLIPLDESVEPDAKIQATLDGFRMDIDSNYFGKFGYSSDQILADNDIEFENTEALSAEHTEHALGDIMSDAYRYTLNNLDNGEPPVDVAVVPSGVVRGTYVQGGITAGNVFESFSLGNGPDNIAGYPLLSVYLTGAELKTAAEVDATVSDFMTVARLYMSGLSFSYNPHRLILNKVTNVQLQPNLGDDTYFETLKDDKLYRVVADLYSGRMLGAVTKQSFGILKLVPKFADGTPVENFEDCIIYDNEGREVKAWAAIANYMNSFEDTDGNGIGNVPQYYASNMHNRKVVDDSRSIGALLKNPSKYAVIICLAVLAVILLLILIVVLIVKLVKKIIRRKKKNR